MANKTVAQKGLGMGWHKFLLFLLWIGAAINLLLGAAYALIPDMLFDPNVLAANPMIQPLFMVVGAALILVSLYQFFMRGRLKRLRKGSPTLLTISYILVAIVNLASIIGPVVIAPDLFTLDSTEVTSTITSAIVWIVVNTSYYKKRADMFE